VEALSNNLHILNLKLCEVTFVTLTCLRRIKCICTRAIRPN